MSRWLAAVAMVTAGLSAACVSEPVNQDCVEACEAQNACADAKREPCDDLCGAVPDRCDEEHTAYWGCAAANIEQACNSFTACGSELADMSICISAYCLFKPFSRDCSY